MIAGWGAGYPTPYHSAAWLHNSQSANSQARVGKGRMNFPRSSVAPRSDWTNDGWMGGLREVLVVYWTLPWPTKPGASSCMLLLHISFVMVTLTCHIASIRRPLMDNRLAWLRGKVLTILTIPTWPNRERKPGLGRRDRHSRNYSTSKTSSPLILRACDNIG